MAITVSSQPASNGLESAYRAIQFGISLTESIPIVFCDIYFDGIFYKSLYATLPELTHTFDIQDAAQEYLSKYIGPNGGSTVVGALKLHTTCFCKFRGSTLDADGLTQVETPVPVQATGSNPAVAGGGVSSNSFYIINSTLQHEDNQDLALHLNSFKTGSWNSNAYPLSHRKDGYKIAGSDYFPIFYTGTDLLSCLKISYTKKDGSTGVLNTCDSYPDCPLLTGITITPVDNENGVNQKFVFDWDTPSPLLVMVRIMYRIHGSSDPWTVYETTLGTGQSITLPLGKYDFKFRVIGYCNPQETAEFTDLGFDVPSCAPATLISSTTMPNAIIETAYNHFIVISGSMPIVLDTIVKPSWMTITIFNNTVTFSGKPTASDLGVSVVSFGFSNPCGSGTFSSTITVQFSTLTLLIGTLISGSYAYAYGQLSDVLDIDINLKQIMSDGYIESDCTGTVPVAHVQANSRIIPAGSLTNGESNFLSGDWSTVNTYRISNVLLLIPGYYGGGVTHGQVIDFRSYSLTIQFLGCL